jgi:hypothetical protein
MKLRDHDKRIGSCLKINSISVRAVGSEFEATLSAANVAS